METCGRYNGYKAENSPQDGYSYHETGIRTENRRFYSQIAVWKEIIHIKINCKEMKGNVKVLAGFLLLFSMTSCGNSYEDEIQKKVPQLAEMADLGSVEYTVKKIIKADDIGEWYKIGDRKILFTCTAYLKAGVDLSGFTMENVAIDNKNVTITLPHAKLLSLNMPADQTKMVYSQVSILRSDFSAEERNNLLRQGEEDIRKDIANIGILNDAETNAADFFKAMLSQMGFETVTVNFE